jgi:hypothetical protein
MLFLGLWLEKLFKMPSRIQKNAFNPDLSGEYHLSYYSKIHCEKYMIFSLNFLYDFNDMTYFQTIRRVL